jgi:enamine deaminase RidA (YjgF/YER057c/UK114 family)
MASHIPLIPDDLAPPAANYAHAVVTEDARRWLHTSGVVPVKPDGSVPVSIGQQAEVVWTILSTLLADAQMAPTDIVSVTTYVVDGAADGANLAEVMAARDRALGGHKAASTLLIVPRLARPEWKMEIALVAST